MNTNFYAVKIGKNGPAIYRTWSECKKNVIGFNGSKYKKFIHLVDAKNYINNINPQHIPINYQKYLHIYTDGSVINEIGGSGLYIPEWHLKVSIRLPGTKHTNQRAELYAVIEAIKIASNRSNKPLLICTDSQYVIGQHYSSKINSDLWNTLKKISDGLIIKYLKIKAHSNDIYNDIADQLSKCATSNFDN